MRIEAVRRVRFEAPAQVSIFAFWNWFLKKIINRSEVSNEI